MQAVGVAEDNIFKKRKEDEVQCSALIKENNQWFPLRTPECSPYLTLCSHGGVLFIGDYVRICFASCRRISKGEQRKRRNE